MCANQFSTWMAITECPVTNYDNHIRIPTGIDKNNYIAIENEWWLLEESVICIHKYDIDNNKWIKMDGVNNTEIISYCCTSFDVKKQILFLLNRDQLTQMQLNNTNIIQHCESNQYNEINLTTSTKIISVNNSLFIIGGFGGHNDSIWQWNVENKKM
eukprot:418259_1